MSASAGLAPVSRGWRLVYILGVSLALLAGLCWLILRARLPIRPVLAFLGAFLRPRWRVTLREIAPESGFCHVAPVPRWIQSDRDGASGLELYEDGAKLPLGHASHEAIRTLGCGRYSHWGDMLYFASSDNSDPRRNGRRYRLVETRW